MFRNTLKKHLDAVLRESVAPSLVESVSEAARAAVELALAEALGFTELAEAPKATAEKAPEPAAKKEADKPKRGRKKKKADPEPEPKAEPEVIAEAGEGGPDDDDGADDFPDDLKDPAVDDDSLFGGDEDDDDDWDALD